MDFANAFASLSDGPKITYPQLLAIQASGYTGCIISPTDQPRTEKLGDFYAIVKFSLQLEVDRLQHDIETLEGVKPLNAN